MSWFQNHRNLADLCEDLLDRGEIRSAEDVLGVCEKPWHYEREWARLLREGPYAEQDEEQAA